MPTAFVIRATALYFPVVTTMVLWFTQRPHKSARAGILLACVWNLVSLFPVHMLAGHTGWWSFHAQGGLLCGLPVDLYLGWVVLWGALPLLAFPSLPLPQVALIFFALDAICMPRMKPMVFLGPRWWVGDIIAVALCLVPSQALGRWTRDGTHLSGRAFMQVIAFGGLVIGLVPAVILANTAGTWDALRTRPVWVTSAVLQLLAVPAILGLSSVQEFVQRGGGTPLPYDPPKHLVTSGIYAYLANPMQVSAVVLLCGWGWYLGSLWVATAGLMAHIYSAGLAGWDEAEDAGKRFGEAWIEYRHHVRNWIPRWRPWNSGASVARLYVSATCATCSEVKYWFERQGPTGMEVVSAESYAGAGLMRITYDPGDGRAQVQGVAAIARGLQHIHFGFALFGSLVLLPGVCQLVQLLADASGAGPRTITSRPAAGQSEAVRFPST